MQDALDVFREKEKAEARGDMTELADHIRSAQEPRVFIGPHRYRFPDDLVPVHEADELLLLYVKEYTFPSDTDALGIITDQFWYDIAGDCFFGPQWQWKVLATKICRGIYYNIMDKAYIRKIGLLLHASGHHAHTAIVLKGMDSKDEDGMAMDGDDIALAKMRVVYYTAGKLTFANGVHGPSTNMNHLNSMAFDGIGKLRH